MVKRKSLTKVIKTSCKNGTILTQELDERIDCKKIKQLLENHHYNVNTQHNQNNIQSDETPPTSEVHEKATLAESMLLDLRTYICAHGKCRFQYNRSHRRISYYNWIKMQKNKTDLRKIINLAQKITTPETSHNELGKGMIKTASSSQKTNMKCIYCLDPKLKGVRHTHFIKSEQAIEILNDNPRIQYAPIENIFTQIDKKARKNTEIILTGKCPNPPGNKILQNNEHRMSYGDINYLGNNKALLYFDRGSRGIQTFTNSMHPISKQHKFKDLIIVDDIVFTSNCKCDSALQHKEMFPHYRITCAVGLTCPKNLNNFDREIFKRKRNASTEMYTKASSMLIRYWR